MSKRFFYLFLLFIFPALLTGCSTNPATGQTQFTALMSPQQEQSIGAQEYQKVISEFGVYDDRVLQSYVNMIGQRVVQDTERKDVQYQFTLLDSPMVNAFALPGGYIYITRGLMCLANSEAEIAAVLAHETGHITARHSAERYSQSVVTSLGAAVLASAIGNDGVTQVLGVSSDLYLKSYSRGQEEQADELGLRYMSRAGYDVRGMPIFLSSLQADNSLEGRMAGHDSASGSDYFSTHPATQERVSKAVVLSGQYPQGGFINKDDYLRRIDGLVYGDSAVQGFVRGQNFYQPAMGFTFSVPPEFYMTNQPSKVIATSPNGSLIIFDMVNNLHRVSPMEFLIRDWLQDQTVDAEYITVNGLRAASAALLGTVDGREMNLRLVAIEWGNGQIARFQIAYPDGLSSVQLDDLKRATYSFRYLAREQAIRIRPYRIEIVTAGVNDTAESLAEHMDLRDGFQLGRFRVLNGLGVNDLVVAGQAYKIVME